MTTATKKTIKPAIENSDLGSFIYRNIYYIGIQTKRYSKRFFKRCFNLLFRPIGHFFLAIAMFIYTLINHFIVRSISAFSDEGKFFRKELHAAKAYMLRAIRIKKSSVSAINIFFHYIKKIFNHHKRFLIKLTYIVAPISAAIILFLTVVVFSNITFALEVNYEGKNIGYISDESVYIKAYEIAKTKTSQDSSEKTTENLLVSPSYNLKIVPTNKLSNAETLSNNIIENSDSNFVNAYGIYINDEFLCSIVNKIDAETIFNNLIKINSVGIDENSVVDFYDDIQYIQGFYLNNDDTMWDASTLSNVIRCSKTPDSFHTVIKGDTADIIATTYNISTKELADLNPGIDINNISEGQQLLINKNIKYIRLKTVITEYAQEKIPYDTEKTETSNLFKGSKQVVKRGVPGIEQITSLATYVEGVRISSEEKERTVVSKPINEKVLIGIRTTSPASGTYSLPQLESGFVWPTIGAYQITEGFGYYAWRGKTHTAVDISGPNASGKTIVAAAAGTVTFAGWSKGGYGYCVKIDHGSGIETLYAHCLEGSLGVSAGQKVSQGQAIAKIGSTGNSTGAHLHFEVIINGTKVNPQYYLGY